MPFSITCRAMLAATAALAIAASGALAQDQVQLRLSAVNSETDQRAIAMIAIDGDELVIGATRAARQALGLTGENLARPVPVADLFGIVDGDLEAAGRGVLQRALARAGGNASAAAQALGISRAALYRKLNRLGLS